jgi:DNA-binding MarR family transcriptional regulator
MLHEFLQLIDEVRLLDHRLVQIADRLHHDEPVSVSERAVLEFLLRNGPTTVPAIARARHVTRQHIQIGVNALLTGALIERRANPAHARSPLLALTEAGQQQMQTMQAREGELIASLPLDADPEDLAAAARVLTAVRNALPSDNDPNTDKDER